ncbi:ArsR/SmtB family transcription factor [Brevibacillus sp. SYSU BS000544]|uniref:ArsR/SmtB family transcription factor n=1 Tax=Brevibacillus sp. SYSU BS000544 TaxID=3416443 RepID=UPI003CE49DDB
MELKRLAETLKILGDPTKLKMIILLTEKEYCVSDFVEVINISQPSISKHLSLLKSVGLVTESRRGMWVYYSLNSQALENVKQAIDDISIYLDKIE